MRKLSVANSKKTILVDDEDFSRASLHSWHLNGNRAAARISGKITYIARYILRVTDSNLVVDHIDGNGLNNTKGNLRICSNLENSWNQKKRSNVTSSYKGVSWHEQIGRWRAEIMANGFKMSLGCYANEEDAAKAYNEAALKYYGEFARVNET